jgi:hypothetical protein
MASTWAGNVLGTQVGKTLWKTLILGLDGLGKIRGQAESAGNSSQNPPRVIFCSAQPYAHRQITSDWVKDTLCTASTAATTTTMRYIR